MHRHHLERHTMKQIATPTSSSLSSIDEDALAASFDDRKPTRREIRHALLDADLDLEDVFDDEIAETREPWWAIVRHDS